MGSIIRYHGGKVRLAPKLVSLMPPCRCYIEPFGGGAGVLLARERVKLEVYNDLAGEMVTLFKVLRDHSDALEKAISATPFARQEHQLAQDLNQTDPVEVARRVLVRSHFGHGSNGIYKSTGFRGAGMRAGTLPVQLWAHLPAVIRETAERMRGVVIECRPAATVIEAYDGPDTLHYVDPPYMPSTRGKGGDYKHELTEADHADLLSLLLTLEGKVVLSGYTHPLYDEVLKEWRRVEIATKADRALDRTEVVWMNFEDQAPLFAASDTAP